MTREEIQAVIDKGGCLVSTDGIPEIHYGIMRIEGDRVYFQNAKYMDTGLSSTSVEDWYMIEINWREATPEEIAKYVKEEKV